MQCSSAGEACNPKLTIETKELQKSLFLLTKYLRKRWSNRIEKFFDNIHPTQAPPSPPKKRNTLLGSSTTDIKDFYTLVKLPSMSQTKAHRKDQES